MAEPKQGPAPRGANKRGAARLAAVQALYQMDVAGSGLLETTAEYEAFRLGKELDGAVYREADPAWFRSILAGVKAAATHDMLTVLKSVDQDLLKAAVAGERFAEYFYANSQDDGISAYLRELTGTREHAPA